jgi:CheY-like chemotaxis protein
MENASCPKAPADSTSAPVVSLILHVRQRTPHQQSPRATRGRGVLVIDDDPAALDVIATLLEPVEVQVTTARLASEALAVLTAGPPPDVIITDHDMPGMTGAELCQRVRADAALATTYIIMLTAHGDQDPGYFLGRGADEHIAKPYQAPVLRASVRAALRSQAHRRVMARRERRRAIEWLAAVVAHELNNPLAAALSGLEYMGQILADAPSAEQVTEACELIKESRGTLLRIAEASKRLNVQQSIEVGGATTIASEELVKRLGECLQRFERGGEVVAGDGSAMSGRVDVVLLIHVATAVLDEALRRCGGEVGVIVHFDSYRVAVLVEVDGAPDEDPESILEPRLVSADGGPARYDPGLSGVESGFARFGGQIFARPQGNKWRFGLTLPVEPESPADM